MKKSTILEQTISGFRFLTPEDFESLTSELAKFGNNADSPDDNKLASNLMKDLPKLQLLHDAAVRRYLQRIESHTSIIKTIMAIYFICSLITALYFISKVD